MLVVVIPSRDTEWKWLWKVNEKSITFNMWPRFSIEGEFSPSLSCHCHHFTIHVVIDSKAKSRNCINVDIIKIDFGKLCHGIEKVTSCAMFGKIFEGYKRESNLIKHSGTHFVLICSRRNFFNLLRLSVKLIKISSRVERSQASLTISG